MRPLADRIGAAYVCMIKPDTPICSTYIPNDKNGIGLYVVNLLVLFLCELGVVEPFAFSRSNDKRYFL